jgi:hypothetical protein
MIRRVTLYGEVKSLRLVAEGKPSVNSANLVMRRRPESE